MLFLTYFSKHYAIFEQRSFANVEGIAFRIKYYVSEYTPTVIPIYILRLIFWILLKHKTINLSVLFPIVRKYIKYIM